MIRRTAFVFGTIAFCLAHVIGVFASVSPLPRILRSGLAALIGVLVGALSGWVVQRIVLARFARDWPPEETPS